MRKPFQAIASLALLFFGASFVPANGQSSRPNIIMMMADDMGWGDMDFAVRLGVDDAGSDVMYPGTSLWETPNLNAMATNGLTFSRMYSQSPVCSPTRASVLTGRAPERIGIPFANLGNMENREVTVAEYAQMVGYTTGIFGKWHLGSMTREFQDSNRGGPGTHSIYSTPLNNGFDVQYVTESKVSTYDPADSGLTPVTRYWTGPNEFVPLDSPDLDGDDSAIISRETNTFIEQAVKNNEPFVAVSWFHTPHKPVNTPNNSNRDNLPAYRFAMEDLDRAIGEIRDKVQELGIAENTILMFTSDNGPEDGQDYNADGLRANKRELFEGGVRVPGIVEWPSQITPGVTHAPAVTTDYLPTLLDIWGIDPVDNRPIDGVSIAETFFSDRSALRQKTIEFKSTNGHQSAIGVDGRYKLISTNSGRLWSLYDIVEDYDENNPLATNLTIASANAETKAIYNQLLADYNVRAASITESLSGNISGDYETRIAASVGINLQAEPPENLEAGSVVSTDPSLYLERQYATVRQPIEMESDGMAGTHSISGAVALDAGTVVHSYLIHLDPGSATANSDFTIIFEDPIVGVIGKSSSLSASDVLSFADPVFETGESRGLEAGDSWVISNDSRSISFSLDAASTLDQVRVLTEYTRHLSGDLNGDRVLDCADIDALSRQIAAGTNLPAFDLTGDGLVDENDLSQWIVDAGAANLPSQNAYLLGDLNLNGIVDSTDLGLLLNNFGSSNDVAYCHGDVKADGIVDSTDLGRLLNNFGATSAMHNAVPEPGSQPLLLLTLVGMTLMSMRRR